MTSKKQLEQLQRENEELKLENASLVKTVSTLIDRVEALQSKPISGMDIRDVADLALRQASHDLQVTAKRASARFRALYESSPDALLEVTKTGTIVRVNRTAHALFTGGSGPIVGGKLASLFAPKFSDDIRAMVTTGFLSGVALSAGLTNGQTVTVKGSSVNLLDDVSYFVSVRENSATVALQKSAFRAERWESLANFAAALAREYNDPMTIIIGRLELVLEVFGEGLDSTVKRHLKIAFDRALGLSVSLRNLRLVGVARIASLNRVFPREHIDAALEELNQKAIALPCEVALAHEYVVGGDANSFPQLLVSVLDLLMRKLSENGAMHIRGHTDQNGHGLEFIAVREQSELLYVLSSPLNWKQCDVTKVSQALDHGLNMYIATVLVESMGGSLTLVESVGVERVLLTFLAPPNVPPIRPRRREKTLVATGDLTFHQALPSGLRKVGVEVIEAHTSVDAVDLVNEEPEIDGILFAEALDNGRIAGMSVARAIGVKGGRFHGRVAIVDPAANEDGTTTDGLVKVFSPPLSSSRLLGWLQSVSDLPAS